MIDMVLNVKVWRKIQNVEEIDETGDGDEGVYLPRKILGIKDTAVMNGNGTRERGGE
ncbi:MAG: hypothetical protein HXS44_09615 [Theionarchaea archaeon]|nr:hypothetical protein [Theionarchaea archaeon]